MEQTHKLTLEAITKIPCKKEDNSYHTYKEVQEDKEIQVGKQIIIDVPKSISKSNIFSLPKDSPILDKIISQFHAKKLYISKSQLGSGYWKVVDPSQVKTQEQKI